MSVRNTRAPPVPRWGDPLPRVIDSRSNAVLAHLIPVEGVALQLSAETAHMHAFRRELTMKPLPRAPGGGSQAEAAIDAAVEAISDDEVAVFRPAYARGLAPDPDAPPSIAEHLEVAAAEAAGAGHTKVLVALIAGGAVGHTMNAATDPLAAAARGRQKAASLLLIGAGCSTAETAVLLRAEGDENAAHWLETSL